MCARSCDTWAQRDAAVFAECGLARMRGAEAAAAAVTAKAAEVAERARLFAEHVDRTARHASDESAREARERAAAIAHRRAVMGRVVVRVLVAANFRRFQVRECVFKCARACVRACVRVCLCIERTLRAFVFLRFVARVGCSLAFFLSLSLSLSISVF